MSPVQTRNPRPQTRIPILSAMFRLIDIPLFKGGKGDRVLC